MVGKAYNNIGLSFMNENNLEAAQAALFQSLEPTRTLMRLEPQNRRWEKELGTTLLNLGVLHHKRKDYAGAERYLRDALAVREKVVAWGPQNARWMRQLAHGWNRLAVLQFDKDEAAAALASCRNAMETYRRLLALQPGDAKTIREMDDTARNYRERLEEKKMAGAGLKLYDDTKAFLETQPASKAASKSEKEE
jgi:tetratricopeptide (TPR) repeat protein